MGAYIFPGATLISNASVAAFNAKFGGAKVGGTARIFELDYSDDPWKMSTSVPIVQRQDWDLSLDDPFMYLTCDGCAHCGSGVSSAQSKAISEQIVDALASWGISHSSERAVAV